MNDALSVDGVNGAGDPLDEFGRGAEVERPVLEALAQRAAFEQFDRQIRDRHAAGPANVSTS